MKAIRIFHYYFEINLQFLNTLKSKMFEEILILLISKLCLNQIYIIFIILMVKQKSKLK